MELAEMAKTKVAIVEEMGTSTEKEACEAEVQASEAKWKF